jgi:hypothetical protein
MADETPDELPEDVDPAELQDLELLGDVPALDAVATDDEDDGDDEDDDDADEDDDAKPETLDELEAEELEMLTEDESDEAIVVDEAAEMRAIRRAEIALEGEVADAASSDEFVCSNCFLVKRKTQLVNRRKKLCNDCAG